MKNLLLLLAFVAGAGVSAAQEKKVVAPFAVIKFESQTHDFGKIKQGIPVTHEFKFVNTGKVPLMITNVQPSCGCTTPDWSRDPVLPGGEGFVKATFNASTVGVFSKSISVTANTETGFFQLTIRGEVVGEPGR